MPKPSSTIMVQIARVAGSRSIRAEIAPALKTGAPLSFMFPRLRIGGAPAAFCRRLGAPAYGRVKREIGRGAQPQSLTCLSAAAAAKGAKAMAKSEIAQSIRKGVRKGAAPPLAAEAAATPKISTG